MLYNYECNKLLWIAINFKIQRRDKGNTNIYSLSINISKLPFEKKLLMLILKWLWKKLKLYLFTEGNFPQSKWFANLNLNE